MFKVITYTKKQYICEKPVFKNDLVYEEITCFINKYLNIWMYKV